MMSNMQINNLNSVSNDSFKTKRIFERRSSDKCIAAVKGHDCPVHNWSLGGVLIESDDRLFSVGQEIDMNLKFILDNSIIDIEQQGKIIRKGNGKIAVEFMPLNESIWEGFKKVIDHHAANKFSNSQA